jgi:lipopolysaccharide export system permease protein
MIDVAVAQPHHGSRKRRARPGLVDLYLIRGVAGSFLPILFAVCVAMMLERALRLIQVMATAGADISYFLPLLAQLLPYYLDLGLPAAFMVALILLVARLDDRLELEAMLASGLSLSRIAAPLLALGCLVGLAGLVTGGWLEPHGRYNFRTMNVEALNAGQIGRLQPRAFYQPAESLAVTFDRRAADSSIAGIFVWQLLADGRELIVTGRSGRDRLRPRERQFGLEMDAGLYVAERPGAAWRSPYLVAFESLAFRESLRLRESRWRRGWDQNEMTLPELGAALGTGTGDIPRRAIEAEYYSRISRRRSFPAAAARCCRSPSPPRRADAASASCLCGAILAAFHHGLNFVRSLALGGVVDPAPRSSASPCSARRSRFWYSSPDGTCRATARSRACSSRSANGWRGSPPASSRCPACVAARSPPISPGNWENGACLLWFAMVALLQMVELFQRGEAFVERGMGLVDVGRYALLRLPSMLQQSCRLPRWPAQWRPSPLLAEAMR